MIQSNRRDNEGRGKLPWTPIRETQLRMTPNYGTEGFREANRGSQDYIKSRGGPVQKQQQKQSADNINQQKVPRVPHDELSAQEERTQAAKQGGQEQQQQKQSANFSFPKLSPGRPRNYRPPHVVSAIKVNSELSNVQTDEDVKVDYLENFREGRETSRYLSVSKGSRADVNSRNAAAPAAAVDVGQKQMVSQVTGDEFFDDIQNEDELEIPKDVLSTEFDDDEDNDDYDPTGISNGSLRSENFRDQTRSASSRRSGSDVDFDDDFAIDEDLNDDMLTPSASIGSKEGANPLRPVGKSVYENLGPSSMGFRDGGHMSTFRDDAFNVKDRPLAELLDKRDAKAEETAYDELLGETYYDNTDDGSDDSMKGTLLTIDPKSVDIVPLKKGKAAEEEEKSNPEDGNNDKTSLSAILKDHKFEKWEGLAKTGSFVKMFRGSASYIANHRGTLAVYHIPGELLAWEGFPGLMDDIALTWLLGMKIVLVAGCRHQIDLRLDDMENDEEYNGEGSHSLGGKVMMSSVRVTDEETLRVVKEEAGFVRFEIERRLAKSLRLHGGLLKGSETLVGNVVSGNFYSAQVCFEGLKLELSDFFVSGISKFCTMCILTFTAIWCCGRHRLLLDWISPKG